MKINIKISMLIIVFGIFLLTAGGTAKAQNIFRTAFSADLRGGQIVPPNASTATGFVVVNLNTAETEITVNYTFSGLGSNASAAHIHGPGAAGVDAPPIFTLSPQVTTTGGQLLVNFSVSPVQVEDLKLGLWYLDIHSTNFPNGEIRGQLKPTSPFIANLSAQQVVPPAAGSNGVGTFYLYLNAAQNMIYTYLSYNTVGGGTATGGSIRGPALPGTNGALVRTLGASGGSGANYGFTALSPFDLSLLRRGQYYVEVTTTDFPSGAFRGQIKPAGKFVDFDGDNRTDISVWRPSQGVWHWLNSADNSYTPVQWGTAGDRVMTGDFDGDAKNDLTVWRPGTGDFYTINSYNNTFRFLHFGQFGDFPLVADYDGDGVTDYAVFREATTAGQQSVFYINGSVRGFYYVIWGLINDFPLVADWDGDRVADITIHRFNGDQAAYWGLRSSDGQVYVQSWGLSTDSFATGDVDGDGKSDPIAFRNSGTQAGTWYALGSANGFMAAQFGRSGDTPVPSDYDGDGKTDFAVYRNGVWWILRSASGGASATSFGVSSDYPIPFYLVR